MADTRLIERWMPIAALGEESVRERRSMTALPPIYYLHVWWARRPLVASRAAILASILPANADRDRFMHALGIHGDPVAARRKMDTARRTGVRVENPYSYNRAFSHRPTPSDRAFLRMASPNGTSPVVLDPTAGGGSIPFEAARLGCKVFCNDINPVAALVEKATVEYPARFGSSVKERFEQLARDFRSRIENRLSPLFPQSGAPHALDLTYLWARTVRCPYCDGIVPLAPNWRLAPDGTGVHLSPQCHSGPGSFERRCEFEIVSSANEQSAGTVAGGDGTCPFPDCGRVIPGEEIKRQAQAGGLGEQLYAVAYKQRVEARTKTGKLKEKWVRRYRTIQPSDAQASEAVNSCAEIISDWRHLGIIPNEIYADMHDDRSKAYGVQQWSDLFSPRQLLVHGHAVEIYRELLAEAGAQIDELTRAAFVYLALSIDKMLDYNARLSIWDWTTERSRHVFVKHNIPHVWCYSELNPIAQGLGYDWILEQTAGCIDELVHLLNGPGEADLIERMSPTNDAEVSVTCKPGESLDHLADGSVDVVVIDPPYYDNVMYAELSDFFYVWLKRTAGHVVPELFTRQLTDKENEAVANPNKFQGRKGARALAGRDYQERMARIFEECRRVLKSNGLMTLMFTHKANGAWDALTTSLMKAGFSISASWPINTESEHSIHIKNKAAANSTIFLVCRPREDQREEHSTQYWEDVEPLVARAVRARVVDFQATGITGVDLYLASFGPALEEFSRHWPLKRGTPRPQPEALRRRKQAEMFEEEFDPYAVTPEDALEAARREVKRWRLEQLTHMKAHTELDPLTSWFVLAWDAFRAPVFPYDEALRLARAVGVDLDTQIVGILAEKKGSDLVLWDSARRAAKGALGPADGSRAMIDAIHHAANVSRTRTLQAAREMLEKAKVNTELSFFAALEAVLEVLPVSKTFSGIDLDGDLASAGSDFEALENLRKLAFADQVDEPRQLDLWREAEAA